MAEIPLLLENERFRNHLVQQLTFRHVKNYWLNKYNEFTDKDQLAERRSTLNRVNAFLRQPLVENIVGQAKTTIDFRRVMDERKILLVMLDRRMEDVTSLVGSMIIAEFLDAAYSRENLPIEKRKQFNLYADEFQLFATEDFATLLTEARKFGIATTIAHQIRDQLDLQNKSATLNVANLVVFKISGKDAEDLSAEFRIAPPAAETRREAALTYKQNVLEHLVQQGHESPKVQEFVMKYVQPLRKAVTQEIDKSPMGLRITQLRYTKHPVVEFPEGEAYAYDPDEVKEGLRLLNNMLFQEMSGSKDTSLHVEYDKPNPIDKAFSSILGFPHYYEGYFESAGDADYGKVMSSEYADVQNARVRFYELNEKLKRAMPQGEKDDLEEQRYQAEGVLIYNGCHLVYFHLMQQLSHGYQVGNTSEVYGDKLYPFGYKGYYTEDAIAKGEVVKDIFFREIDRVRDFCYLLHDVVWELKIRPVMAESGRYEEKPLAPRTYADVQKEIASTLANLPRFTARVKIATDTQPVEHTVKTLSPDQGIGRTALEQRKATIKAQNIQQGYYRPRKEVEEEITNRQTHFTNASPAQPQIPQQQNRHARQVPVSGNCPNCGSSKNPSGARFCMQCGTKL